MVRSAMQMISFSGLVLQEETFRIITLSDLVIKESSGVLGIMSWINAGLASIASAR